MSKVKGKLIPGQALIYERADGIVYARYRDPPFNKLPRWIVGGVPEKGLFHNQQELEKLLEVAERVPTLQKALDKVALIWYTIKDDERSEQNI